MNTPEIRRIEQHYQISYFAMASYCEVLIRTKNLELVKNIAQLALAETRRIEHKFSRYTENNLVWQMNHSDGQQVAIDSETYHWLTYANQLFELSDGLFDITSGVLRKIWNFSDNATPPTELEIEQVLPFIGFDKISYDQKNFSLPAGMQIDFGGIGKEYCVDSVSNKIYQICKQAKASYLVNFGGDLMAQCFNPQDPAWKVGVEHVENNTSNDVAPQAVVSVTQGAIATSGSTKRCFIFNGKRFAHILNPKTGFPIDGAPRSVSVFAGSCSLAGGMSTLAQLQGKEAESFLNTQQVKYLCNW